LILQLIETIAMAISENQVPPAPDVVCISIYIVIVFRTMLLIVGSGKLRFVQILLCCSAIVPL